MLRCCQCSSGTAKAGTEPSGHLMSTKNAEREEEDKKIYLQRFLPECPVSWSINQEFGHFHLSWGTCLSAGQ